MNHERQTELAFRPASGRQELVELAFRPASRLIERCRGFSPGVPPAEAGSESHSTQRDAGLKARSTETKQRGDAALKGGSTGVVQ